jgi:hypothetical protein
MSNRHPGITAMTDGSDYRDTRPDPEGLPEGFGDWSRAEQADFIDGEMSRAALLRRVLRIADYDGADLDELDTHSWVTGEMLAAIYAELRGVDHE